MDRQGNIISFDDARRLASAQSAYMGDAYASQAAYPLYTNAASDGTVGASTAYIPADTFDDLSEFVSPFSKAKSHRRSSRMPNSACSDDSDSSFTYRRVDYSGYSGQSGRSVDLSGYSSVSSSGRISRISGESRGPRWQEDDALTPQDSLQSSLRFRSSRFGQDSASLRDERRVSFSQDSSQASVRPAVEVYDDECDDTQEERASQRSKRGKRRAKAKAEKMFAKQFGSDSASAEAGSRAAVYKGEMGRNHKRAFDEMGGSKRASSAALSTSRTPKKLRSSTASRIAVALGCLVCMAAVLLFLYPTAQQVYLESREKDRLQAEYDALVERNTALQERIDYLSTDEGIEDTARQELGWVQEGEIAVVVEGLSEDSEDETSSISTQIASGSIATPETWYSPILDVVFGYTDSTTADDDSSDESSSDE